MQAKEIKNASKDKRKKTKVLVFLLNIHRIIIFLRLCLHLYRKGAQIPWEFFYFRKLLTKFNLQKAFVGALGLKNVFEIIELHCRKMALIVNITFFV